jgi:hypothetical protein
LQIHNLYRYGVVSDTGGLEPACAVGAECHALVAGATVQMRAVTADAYGGGCNKLNVV